MTTNLFLQNIHSPADLRRMSIAEMLVLADEIRAFLVETVTKNGGHLASNLGVVEMTLAIHRVFDSPHDHIIFDVGHQSYVHKILTGRMAEFDTLRQNGGLSGFTKRSESPHDPFGAGHASTSLSAALGMTDADAARNSDAYTICVIGDGAFTGGMIHEALNNIKSNRRLIVILNENEMSISQNNGRFAKHLSILRATEGYHDIKNNTRSLLGSVPVIGNTLVNTAKGVKQSFKNLLYHSNYFENLGLYYLGPADGNDFETVETLLKVAKEAKSAVIVHLKTKKGKGYPPAEKAPDIFHAVPKGKYYHVPAPKKEETLQYSDVFGRTLLRFMGQRNDLRVITAAMTDGTGLRCVAEAKPEYLTDVGIAEEHAITYAAGLAAGGLHPVAAIYSSFLQRSYDNLIHDVALQKLPLTLCIDRAGYNEGDGATHHGIFDVAMLSQLPDADIYAPISYRSLRNALIASFDADHIVAIRYPKGEPDKTVSARFAAYSEEDRPTKSDFAPSEQKKTVLIVTYGRIAKEALQAEALLAEKDIEAGVILLEKLTPYAKRVEELMSYINAETKIICYLEEGIYQGGMGMILRDQMEDFCRSRGIRQKICAIRNPFAPSEKKRRMVESAGIDAQSVASAVISLLKNTDFS